MTQTTTMRREAARPLAFGLTAHPSHRLTRDGADGLDHWHSCLGCGATDAPGDGRLAEPCASGRDAAADDVFEVDENENRTSVVERVFDALNAWLHGGSGCPGAGALGECPVVMPAAAWDGRPYYSGVVAWWPETPPDWRKIVEILHGCGAEAVTVAHVLHSDENGETDGRGPGSATLEISFESGAASEGRTA